MSLIQPFLDERRKKNNHIKCHNKQLRLVIMSWRMCAHDCARANQCMYHLIATRTVFYKFFQLFFDCILQIAVYKILHIVNHPLFFSSNMRLDSLIILPVFVYLPWKGLSRIWIEFDFHRFFFLMNHNSEQWMRWIETFWCHKCSIFLKILSLVFDSMLKSFAFQFSRWHSVLDKRVMLLFSLHCKIIHYIFLVLADLAHSQN